MSQQWIAYLEALGAGAVVAGLQAAYQAVQQQGHTVDWQPVLAAFLVGAMGYLLAALRWLQTPAPQPPVPHPEQVAAAGAAGHSAPPPEVPDITKQAKAMLEAPASSVASAVYIPFTAKSDDSERIVEGYVSSPLVDLDEQIVDPQWLAAQLPPWLTTWGNIREQHDPRKAVGKAQSVDLTAQPGPLLRAKILDDAAWQKIKAGVYNGFSIGIKAPQVIYDGTAKNGRIAGGKLIEISIVDRPANDAARFTLVKAAVGNEWRDAQTGVVVKAVKCALPDCGCTCMEGSPDPACECDCAFCAAQRDDESQGGSQTMTTETTKAVWSTAFQNDLPDSSFAYIEPGGEKDETGKTTPRSLRHFPYKDADGKPDPAHVRNALARIPQSTVSEEAKAEALRKVRAAAKELGIEVGSEGDGDEDKEKAVTTSTQKAVASHVEHRHPFKGTHNHEHDDGHGGTHTHVHMHNDDDLHNHPHCMEHGQDARMCLGQSHTLPEYQRLIEPSYRAAAAAPSVGKAALHAAYDGDHVHTHTHDGRTHSHVHSHHSDADHAHEAEHTDEERRSLAIKGAKTAAAKAGMIGDVTAILRDAAARIEALARETDMDHDGDVDFPANNPPGQPDGADALRQQELRRLYEARSPRPATLSLTFGADPDLTKALQAVTATPADRLTVDQLMADLVKGLAEAKTRGEELAAAKAALTEELERIKAMATPPKGAVFAVDKGLGLEPDRLYLDGKPPDADAAKSAAAKLVSGMSEEERTQFHAELLKQMYGS